MEDIMNASKLLKVMLLFACTALPQSVFASVRAFSQSTVGNENISSPILTPYRESLLHVNKMLSYVNLAYIATDMGRFSRAVSDIQEAQAIASNMELDSPTFVSEAKIKYGKLVTILKVMKLVITSR
jgi:hypothetical protein